MQAKMKVNTEQNQTRSSSLPVADCTATNSLPSDQLITNSPPATVSTAISQSLRSSAVSCSGDAIASRHVRRAEEAWRAYTSRNRSVIVDTFQGQFKSTVSNFCITWFSGVVSLFELLGFVTTLTTIVIIFSHYTDQRVLAGTWVKNYWTS